MIIRSKYILSSALIMKMVVFGIFAADGTVLADEGVTITCPSDYPNIDSNATSENDCWRECTTADVAGSVSVSGRNYYGTGTDTCEPTQCVAGWFIQPAPNLKETIGTDYATNSTSINNNGDIEDSENKGLDYYGIFDKNSFAVEYTDKGILKGYGRCSTQAGVHNYDSNEITTWRALTDETGQEGAIYCYCNVTSFTPTDGSEVIFTSVPWLFNFDGDSADECADSCAHFCNYNFQYPGSFRTTMFNMVGVLPAVCKEVAYTLKVGKYLPADGNIPVDCPNGSYCPGGAFVRWDEKNDQGAVTCPSDYPNSDTGAKSENDCFRKCTTDDVIGAQAVMGNNYYGTGVDTCEEARYFIGAGLYLPAGGEEPLNCPSGYYCPGAGVVKYDPENDQGIKVCPTDFPNSDINSDEKIDCYKPCKTEGVPGVIGEVYGKDYYGNRLDSCKATQCMAGWYIKQEENLWDEVFSVSSSTSGYNSAFIDNNGNYSDLLNNRSQEYYGITENMSFAVDYGSRGMLFGHGRCSTRKEEMANTLIDETGQDGAQYCYCRVDSYKSYDDESLPLEPTPWLFYGQYSASKCASNCSGYCASALRSGGSYMYSVLNKVLTATGGMCVENGTYLLDGEIEPEKCPDEFPLAESGANNFTHCYRQCSTDDIPGAKTVSGVAYYASDTISCEAKECVAGWKKKSGVNVADITSVSGKSYSNVVDYWGNIVCSGCSGKSDNINSFQVDYGSYYSSNGYISGHARCSTLKGENYQTQFKNLTDESGIPGAKYCYCHIDSYTNRDGEVTETVSAPWFFKEDEGSHSNCAYYCSQDCASLLASVNNSGSYSSLISTVLGTDATFSVCEEIIYGVPMGQYLPAGATKPVICPSGSYCPGVVEPQYTVVASQGIDKCPTDYPNSEEGAKSENDCYRECTVADVANSVEVRGWAYNGNGTDSCEPVKCMDGFKLKYIDFGTAVCEKVMLKAGTYIPAGQTEPVDCPSGYYCPGAGDVKYDEEKDQGLFACPSDYPNSDAVAKSENDCYKPCTTDDVAGAMSVTGKNYYGNKANSCKASQCVADWILKDGIDLSKFAGTNSAVSYAYVTDDGNFSEGTDYDYGKYYGQEYYGMTDKNSFGAVLSVLTVKGSARCSTVNADKLSEVSNEMGVDGAEYCYCKLNEYSIYGGEYMPITSSLWMKRDVFFSSADDCVNGCARYCAYGLSKQVYEDGYLVNKFRFNMLEEIKNSSWFCEEKVTCPSDYPNMDGRLNDINKCYRECTTDDVANSMSVVGKNYYGAGADTCAATECVADWRVKPGINLAETIGEAVGINSASINNTGSFGEMNYDGKGSKGQEYYGISGPMSFAVDYASKGILTGHGRCSTQAGTNNGWTWTDPTIVNNLTDETGQEGAQYCYCQVDGFTPTGGDKVIVTSAPWVFRTDVDSADDCASLCTYHCAYNLRNGDVSALTFRAAVMEATGNIGPGTCEEIKYTLNPGEYLPAGGEEPADCPNGSYCPGGETVYWNKDEDQGIKVCPSDYQNSDKGAKTESDCYKPCKVEEVTGAVGEVSGKNYYGSNGGTCAATECMAGWELKPWLNLAETIGEEEGADSAYIRNDGSFSGMNYDGNGAKGQEYYGISGPMSFAVNYAGKGMLTGHGRCSTQEGYGIWTDSNGTPNNPEDVTVVNTLTDETDQEGAQYCYCQVDGFTPTGGDKVMVTSAPWVFYSDFDSADSCAFYCAQYCAIYLRNGDVYNLAFRAAVMDATGNIGPGTCEEITYTLNPGQYLPMGTTEIVDCPSGYYCPGKKDVPYSAVANQGINKCPDGYDRSDVGSDAENDCYRPCKAEEIGAVGEVSGNNYYGSAGRTCAVTECADGWRKGGISDVIGTNQADKRGVVYPDYFSEDVWSGYYMGQDYYGISEVNSFAVDYGYNGMVKGRGICSTKQGEFNYDWGTNTLLNVTTFDELDDETGNYDAQYCYCQVNEYVSSGGGLAQSVSGKWVFNPNYYSSDDCRNYCGYYCADMMVWADPYQLSFRDAVLGGDENSENYCTEILYKIPAGQYIVAGSTEPTKCPSGYYCPGMGDVRLSDDKDQGLITCPTGFPNSNKGAKSENDCYKPCKPGDLYGAIGISGNNYYGSKGTTCSVTECVAGWMVQDFADIIGKNSGTNSAYISSNSGFVCSNNSSFSGGNYSKNDIDGQLYYGISEVNSFAVEYGKRGIITGRARCSTKSGVRSYDRDTQEYSEITTYDELNDESGNDGANYCYCQVDGYIPVSGMAQVLSGQQWVFHEQYSDIESCDMNCVSSCAIRLRWTDAEYIAFRNVVFGPSMCVQASYRLNAGTYLPAGEDTPTKCPVGYYCPGVVNVKTDEENDQGLFKCPVDYPDSDEGAMADTYCYTSCKLENMDAENIIAVTGKDYYGTGADTCVPSECAAGWIVQDLTGIAGQSYASNSAYISTNSGVVGLVDSNGRDMMYYGISELNSFALDFGTKGIITGRARCSSIEGTNDDYTWKNPTILDELADETGQEGAYHCYCQVDGFTMPNKVVQQVSGPWVYRSNYWGDYESCANSCVGDCVQQLKYNNSNNMAFRKAMFVPTMCVQASYRINAGTYLPAGDDTPTKCPVGYYCPGVVNVKLDEENDQGLSKCPSEYPNSDAGATADTQCYTQCTINDVANSMTVVGNNYYGTGTDTCEAIECAPGWLLDLGLGEYAVCADTLSYIEPGTYLPAGNSVVEICLPGSYCPGADNVSYNVDADQGIFACPTEYPNSYTGAKADTECYQTCKIDNGDVTTSGNGNIYYGDENNTCELTECADGWMLKDFAKKIGTENGINSACVSINSGFVEDSYVNDTIMGQMYYGISKPGEFAVGFGENGVITGRGRCSTKSGVKNYDWGTQEYSEITTFDELDDESGNDDARYCYCQVDGYIPVAGLLTQVLSGMPWVFNSESWSGEGCNSYCAAECAGYLRNIYNDEDIAFRAVAFGAKPQDPAICIEESYRLNPGMYLMAGEDTPTKCPSGSYCPGAGDVILNSDKNQGIVKCPSGYPYSDTGATDDTQCYSLCTTDDVANSTSVIGNDYYGDGLDTCAATQCVAGWKLRDLSAIIGNIPGANSAYISTNSYSYGEFRDSAGLNQDYYGLSEPGEFAVDYGDTGIITGRARCSTKPGVGGTNPTVFKELDDESGVDGAQYCYCQVNGYFKQGELIQAISGPWVYHGSCSSDGTSMCEYSCGSYLKWNGTNELAFRSVMFGGATCEQTKYRLNAGTYLPAGKESVEQCVSGSYCPGADNITIDKNKDQGIVKCPSGYPYSDAGVAANTQCYKDCTNDDVANAMTVVGRNYYGDGKDTCKVTDCVAGWHLNPGLDLEDLIGSVYEGSNSEYMAGTNSAYVDNTGSFIEYVKYGEYYGQEYYGIIENNTFAVVYDDKGMITGRARCSSQSENSVENLPGESGNTDAINCYCNIDSYRSGDGIQQSVVAPWIKYGSINWYPGACESNCTYNCTAYMSEYTHLDFRGKMFGAAYEMPSCEVATGASISYELGGGTNYEGAPTSYEYGVGAKIDGVPTRSSSVFISWCRDPELTDCAMSYEISPDATENVTLYAKWQFVCESDKWFHIGDDRMCLYSNKETDKTINFNIDGEVYYLLMSIDPDLRINATSTKKLRMLQNGIIYNGYDWSAK